MKKSKQQTKKTTKPQTWKGLRDLETHLLPMADLAPAADNTRRHSERQFTAFMNALRDLGQHRPAVVDTKGRVIIGNGMLQAATRLGWTHLAAVRIPEGEKDGHLRALTDNTIADLGAWNEPEKGAQVCDLAAEIDLRLYGWTKTELDKELARLTDTAADPARALATEIEAEEEIPTLSADAQAIAGRIIDKLTKRLTALAMKKPGALTGAHGLIIDREGSPALFVLVDPNTLDLITELKRLAAAGDIPEGSPLEVLSQGINT